MKHKSSRPLNVQGTQRKVHTFYLDCNGTRNPLGLCDKCTKIIEKLQTSVKVKKQMLPKLSQKKCANKNQK